MDHILNNSVFMKIQHCTTKFNRNNIDRKTNKPQPRSTEGLFPDPLLNRAEQTRRDDDVIRTPRRTVYDIDYGTGIGPWWAQGAGLNRGFHRCICSGTGDCRCINDSQFENTSIYNELNEC